MNETTQQPTLNLSYAQAETQMGLGYPIALPEWKGFWFSFKGKTIVFTKDNEFLDTPHYENYKDRMDWMVPEVNEELAVRVIKGLRISIDSIYSLMAAKELLEVNRETSLAKTELQTAFMWLGYLLAEIGTPSPYPQSMNTASPVIEKHADKAYEYTSMLKTLGSFDETGQVKYLRVQVSLYIDAINWLHARVFQSGDGSIRIPRNTTNLEPYISASKEVIVHLMNVRLWLGQQLNNIKERTEGQKA